MQVDDCIHVGPQAVYDGVEGDLLRRLGSARVERPAREIDADHIVGSDFAQDDAGARDEDLLAAREARADVAARASDQPSIVGLDRVARDLLLQAGRSHGTKTILMGSPSRSRRMRKPCWI